MIIQEEYDVNIYVDSINIFGAPGVAFGALDIYEGITDPVPTCTLSLTVPTGWIDERSLIDGTRIDITIECKLYNISEWLSFRLYNVERIVMNQDFCGLQLSGLLDFYPGYKYSNELNLYGTSADVFKNIAAKFELETEIDNTNDIQLWAAGENNLYQFLGSIAKHGWNDETSAMVWCFDRHKILLYKNLTQLFRTRSATPWTFIQQPNPNIKEKIFGYTNASIQIDAGKENLIYGGYGGVDNYFDVLEYKWKEVSAKKVIAESNIININKELSQGLAQEWYPFDVGNFHKNYWLAKNQNERILSTYSTYVTVECSYLMPYRLCQIVNFVYMDGNSLDNMLKLTTGTYMISAIKISINTKSVTSTLKLAMQGINGTTPREVY